MQIVLFGATGMVGFLPDGWSQALELGLGGAFTTAVLSWLLLRRRPWGEPGPGVIRLRYPKAMRAVVWICAIALAAAFAAVALFVGVPPDDRFVVGLAIAAFELLFASLLIEVSFVVHELDASGLLATSPWRGRRFLPWAEVTRLRFDAPGQAWLVVSSTGDSVAIPRFFSGLGAFAAHVLEHVRPEVIDGDPQTRPRLERLELGWAD